ncbi:UNVERIFIED_CONTAM: hypothetical protein Slati_4006600 [Sesamum latifolium]|uniref:AT hook motif-containing protein n=1 Tax=Sesamum latifolium TaxID=2727402 RepID=A0AAW2TRQ4_9LAMI
MDQVYHGESSGGLSAYPVKRKRGRPRKDPSLKRTGTARVPPGFEGVKEHLPQRADRTDGIDSMVGQAVTGVVEATFDAGYLLSVRIGNSNTNLRGVVFKPGHFIPVTAENDVAPHLQMIRRNDVNFPAEKQGRSRRQKLAMVPVKRKYASPKIAPSVPPVGVRGTVVPVVLQPVNFPSGVPTPSQMPSDASRMANLMSFGDKMCIWSNHYPCYHQIDLYLSTKFFWAHNSRPATKFPKEVSRMTVNLSMRLDKEKKASQLSQLMLTTRALRRLQMSKPRTVRKHRNLQQKIQALQENMKENQLQIAEQPPTASKVEFHEAKVTETNTRNEASVP